MSEVSCAAAVDSAIANTVVTNGNCTAAKKELTKERSRARNRLRSICRDVDFLSRIVRLHRDDTADVTKTWPVISNERCGSWYGHPYEEGSCYFKSTDGHSGTWNFSLKRLNLGVVRAVSASGGGCIIVDSSKSKMMPDSLSRTIPIWAAVMNAAALYYSKDRGIELENWDTTLFTPPSVSESEREQMVERIGDMASKLASCGAIDPNWMLKNLTRPLRPYWITNTVDVEVPDYASRYLCIVCVSCSESGASQACREIPYWYTAGAADDHESWSRGLVPDLFWTHKVQIMAEAETADDTEKVIDKIVHTAREGDEEWYQQSGKSAFSATQDKSGMFNRIGSSLMSIGTRRAGRPPDCWNNFEAILNVTTMEYDGMQSGEGVPSGRYYLCCPVKEGKKDRTELENWMSVALTFIIANIASGRRVLIHCAQGMDRSVAVAMAAAAIFCDHGGERNLSLHPWCSYISLENLEKKIAKGVANSDNDSAEYKATGVTCGSVDALKGRDGRDLFLSWVREASCANSDDDDTPPFATKDSLRLTLHMIQRYHERGCPSRSTMQKLNRFFMSSTTF